MHGAELRRARAALEQRDQALEAKEIELQGKEAELQCEKTAAATLTATLVEKDATLAKKVAVRNAAATLKEKDTSLSMLLDAARAQLEEAQGSIAGKCPRFCLT